MTHARGLCTSKNFVSHSHHVQEPQILARALVHHLLPHAPPSRISPSRTHRKILVTEFAPDAYDLDPFRLIGFNKEVVSHGLHPSAPPRRAFSLPIIVASTQPLGGRCTRFLRRTSVQLILSPSKRKILFCGARHA